MSRGRIDNVIFDIGRVLVRWEPERLYRTLFKSEAEIAAFFAETGLIERNLEFDRGEPFATGLADLAGRFPHYADALYAFDTRWAETINGEIPESVGILNALRGAGVPNFAITNFAREKFDVALRLHPMLGQFDDIVVSADVKLIKPDPAIFRLLIDRQGLDPARTLFIDDSAKNIAAARELGLAVHLFDEANQGALTQECVEFGLPVAVGT
jgi:2-haloacid dehalogenase